MNLYQNEEVAWQRLKDLQREYENSRLMASSVGPALARRAGVLARRAWWLAGLAMRRAPRPSPAAVDAALTAMPDDVDAASHAA